MSTNILGIGYSALNAAQTGLATTGHNIANASTPGYSRQVVIQGSAGAQYWGMGFIGKGAHVQDIKRVFSDLLAVNVRNSYSAQNHVATYHAQISRINNQFADPVTGLSPVLQDFFKGIQDLAANPSLAASRQSALSSAEALAARFQALSGQLKELEAGVNMQLQSSIGNINVYAEQIARLNEAIEKSEGNATGKAPNDLLDERDHVIAQLSKEVRTTVVKQGESYNVFIGSGQPLVMGERSYQLVPMSSPTDPTRLTIGYASKGQNLLLSEAAFPGGKLGGLLDFRSQSLDPAQNALGRIAVGLAWNVNQQHAMGQDLNGNMGGDVFRIAAPSVQANTNNTASPPARVEATFTDPNALTTSDYMLQAMGGGTYRLTRLSDRAVTEISSLPHEVDGFRIDLSSGTPADGDSFLIRPTVNGASEFKVLIKDVALLAAAAPIRTRAAGSNAGTGTISAGEITTPSFSSDLLPLTLTHGANPDTLTGFPPGTEITVPMPDGSTDTRIADANGAIPYSPGETFNLGGMRFSISGVPADGDTFTIEANAGGIGDSRNAVLLGALQTTNTLANGKMTYQGAFGQLVSSIANKTREVEVTARAEERFLEQALTAQQSESGVNLDEEATNLLRYQQAYQAAAKLMQTTSQLFELLVRLGG